MIPLFAVFRVETRYFETCPIWLPLFLAWLLLLPLALLVAPFFLIACLVLWVNPGRAIAVMWGILAAMKGTEIHVAERRHGVKITLR